jgi:putative hemolysin
LLVVDEYGGLEGMLTQEVMTDWMLSTVAPWTNEKEIYPIELDPSLDLPPGTRAYSANGSTRLSDVWEHIGRSIPEEEGIDTLAGLILASTGTVPKMELTVELHDLRFTVKRLVRREIQQVEILVLPTTSEDPPSNGFGTDTELLEGHSSFA